MKKNIITLSILVTIIYSCNENKSSTDHTKMQHNIDTADNISKQKPTLMQSMMDMDAAMANTKYTNIPDKDFATMMLIHHKGAINMIDILLENGKNATLKTLATKMKADQLKEISTFTSFLDSTKDATIVNDFGAKLMSSMDGMMNAPHKMDGSIDEQFTSMMIPHHQGAVDMAKLYLPFAKDATLKILAQNIIAAQTKEIDEMRQIK